MFKKIMFATGVLGVFAATLVAPMANAQVSSTTTSSTTSASSTASTTVASSSQTTSSVSSTAQPTSSTTAPAPVVSTSTGGMPVTSGYVQFNGLIVTSVSSTATGPAIIMAEDPGYMNNGTSSAIHCEWFAADTSTIGVISACPAPPTTSSTTVIMTSTPQLLVSTPASTTATTTSVLSYNPYTIEIFATTNLLLADRTPATLATFVPGDTINAYGYYNVGGIIDAEVVRDLSTSTNGATDVSLSTSTANLQAEIDQLEALLKQLEADLNMASSGASTTTTTDTSTVSLCPMMTPSSTECPHPSSTSTGTIVY